MQACLVATPVLEHVARQRAGMVLGVGRAAAYVDAGGFVIVLTTREVPLLPNAVALPEAAGALQGLSPGRAARFGPGRIQVGRVTATWPADDPPAWDPSVPAAAVPRDAVGHRGRAILDALGLAVDVGVLGPGGDRAGAVDRLGTVLAERGLETMRDRGAADALLTLLEAITGGAVELAAAAGALLGRGPGLTPEGDDLLAAIVVTLGALGPAAGLPASALREWRAACCPADRDRRTTALSATLLDLAAAGRALEPVRRLLDLSPAGERAWREALARLQRLGHSTGQAYAVGTGLAAIALVARSP